MQNQSDNLRRTELSNGLPKASSTPKGQKPDITSQMSADRMHHMEKFFNDYLESGKEQTHMKMLINTLLEIEKKHHRTANPATSDQSSGKTSTPEAMSGPSRGSGLLPPSGAAGPSVKRQEGNLSVADVRKIYKDHPTQFVESKKVLESDQQKHGTPGKMSSTGIKVKVKVEADSDGEYTDKAYQPQTNQESSAGREITPPNILNKRKAENCISVQRELNPPSKKKKKPDASSRKEIFTPHENLALVKNLVPVYDELCGVNMSTKGQLWRKKRWNKITRAVNAVGIVRRTPENIKKRYQDIKRKLRNKLISAKQNYTSTGLENTVTFTDYEKLLIQYIQDKNNGTINVPDVWPSTSSTGDVFIEDAEVIYGNLSSEAVNDQVETQNNTGMPDMYEESFPAESPPPDRRILYEQAENECFHNSEAEYGILEMHLQALLAEMKGIHTALLDFSKSTAEYRSRKLELLSQSNTRAASGKMNPSEKRISHGGLGMLPSNLKK